MRASVKNNPREAQRQKEGENKAKENAARSFNGILGMSMPSTYYNLFNLDNQLSNKKALALDLGTFALLGGTGALAKQVIGKKLAQNTFENRIAGQIARKNSRKTAENHALFQADVYRGGKDGSWYTTDKKYASQYGPVNKYKIEAKKVYQPDEPLIISSKDPASEDLIIDYWTNGENDYNRSIILGHDKVTGEFPYTSKGLEILSLDRNNILPIPNRTQGKTSLIFYQRPSKLTEAERLGIPKSQRNNVSRHLNKYAREYDNIIQSGEITPEKQSTLQYLVDQYYKHSAEFPIMSAEYSYYPRVFKHGSNSRFTVFDKSKFGSTDGGYHGEAFYTSPTDFRIKTPKESIHGERAIFSMGNRPYQYSLYLRNPKPYTITSNHGEGFSWFNRYPNGAIITNNGNGYFHGKHFTETLFTNPRQAKLANAITYDNTGNIIPLRNRFNWNNPDMRYKSGGKLNYLNYFK